MMWSSSPLHFQILSFFARILNFNRLKNYIYPLEFTNSSPFKYFWMLQPRGGFMNFTQSTTFGESQILQTWVLLILIKDRVGLLRNNATRHTRPSGIRDDCLFYDCCKRVKAVVYLVKRRPLLNSDSVPSHLYGCLGT